MARRVTSRRLVERERERMPLWAAVERAGAGDPSVVVVVGEAGVGKSRLVQDLLERAREARAVTLAGDCLELDGGEVPYAPVSAALRDLPAATVDDLRAGMPRRAWAELLRAFPALWSGDDDFFDESTPIDRFSQGRLFEFLLALLRRLSARAPVLMVVEDLHWSDPSTRDLIRFLLHNLRTERLALVLTYRDDELPDDHPTRRFFAEVLRSKRTDCVRLRPLSRRAIAEQIAEILGTEAPRELLDEIHRRSGGNPFYAEELLAERTAGEEDIGVASTLQDAVRLRLARLGSENLPVLRAGAVLRRPAPAELLAAVAGVDRPTVSAALRTATQHHVLVRLPAETFGFRHDLVREIVYDDLLQADRAELHERAGQALAAAEPAAVPAELAFHWRLAGRRSEALAASVEAARDAEAARALAEARGHLEHALELWAGADHRPDALDRRQLLERAARLARYCGDYPRAIELCHAALEELDAGAEPVRAARLHELRGRCENFDEDCGLASFRRALELLPPGPSAERARMMGAEGFALIGLHRWAEARDRCSAAVALAAEVGATEELAYARARLGLALAFTGEAAAGEQQLLAAREAAEQLDLAEDLLYCDLYLGEVRRLRGGFDAAYAAMVAGEEAARRLGMEASFGRFMALNAAADLVVLGRWDEAARTLAETGGLQLEPWETLLREQVAGHLAVLRGDADAAERHLEAARSMCEDGAPADYVPATFAALAERSLWHGRPDEACATVEAALARVSDSFDPLNTPVLYAVGTRACADLAERSAITGAHADGERARTRAAGLLAALDRLLRDSGGCASARAHLAVCAAEVSRSAGKADVDGWRAAAEAWLGLEAPHPAAYARWRQAEALLAAGVSRREPARVLAEARRTAVRLGAAPLRREIEDLAHRARIRLEDEAAVPAPTDETGEAPPLGLTPREVEVLRLIAEGLTNRQIADRLFISEKTAGVHVSHIFAKLDVHNRLAAAGVAHRLGLSRSDPDGE